MKNTYKTLESLYKPQVKRRTCLHCGEEMGGGLMGIAAHFVECKKNDNAHEVLRLHSLMMEEIKNKIPL